MNNPGQDDFSFTLTASFNIWDNLLTRVEYRLDDLGGAATGTTNTTGEAFGSKSNYVANEISLNAVYSF